MLHGEVHQAQVVQDLPVKGSQVVCPLQAADSLGKKKRDKCAKTASKLQESCACMKLDADGRKNGNWILTATYFFFPKKHMPMLFQRGGLSGTLLATTLYLERATSKSPWACIMLPAARVAWGQDSRDTLTALPAQTQQGHQRTK